VKRGRMPGAAALSGDAAVTPVLGSILVLAISVMGIAAVLLWGAPTVDRIQSRNAQVAMLGEMEGMRDATMELSVPDHSRFPTVALPGGELALEEGTRIMVTADLDGANPGCDFHVSEWNDAGGNVAIATTGCRAVEATCPPATAGNACLEAYQVAGGTTVKQTVTLAGSSATVAGADLSQGDWMFQLTDAATSPTIYAQAWLHETDRLSWSLPAATGRRELFQDAGAIFSRSDDTFFLEKAPSLGDTAYGADYYGLWLRTLVATSESSLSGTGTHQVYFSLLGNSVRTDADAATRLRFDFNGDLSEPWCNALLARNPTLSGAAYAEDAAFDCATGDAQGTRSVVYTRTGNAAFQFRFLHARIHTSLVV
jgi:hypothetical protein